MTIDITQPEGDTVNPDNDLLQAKNVEQNDNAENEKNKTSTKVVSKETAYQILNILQGAVRRGTSSKLASLGLPIASKTGTSNGGKDMWNIVISPELVIVVYVGFDQPMETNNYGAQYALPVSKEILSKIQDKYHFNNFQTPDSIKFVKINRHTGQQTNANLDNDVIFEAFKENDEILQETNEETHTDEDNNIDITDL